MSLLLSSIRNRSVTRTVTRNITSIPLCGKSGDSQSQQVRAFEISSEYRCNSIPLGLLSETENAPSRSFRFSGCLSIPRLSWRLSTLPVPFSMSAYEKQRTNRRLIDSHHCVMEGRSLLVNLTIIQAISRNACLMA